MPLKISIFISLTLILFASCSQSHYSWQQTEEGTYLFLEDEQGVSYSWQGETFDKVAHGNGKLTKSKGSTIISSENKNAFYGSLDDNEVTNLNNGGKYIGNLVEDKMSGFGVLIQGSDLYIGDFRDGKPDGILNQYKNNHIYYSGAWQNGLFNGNGILYKEDGKKSEGIWRDNKLAYTFVDIDLPQGHYTGYIKDGMPINEGIMLYSDSCLYDGEWDNGMWNGYGTFTSATESISGNWEKGILNGNGSYISSQFTYEGGWNNNDFDGYGILDWSNGDFYEGYWRNGLQNGYGIYHSKSFSYNGNWEEGWMNGNGYIKYENGDTYDGNFVENERYGQGIYKFANGNVYDGEFVDNKFQGLGSFYFNDGYIYDGEFVNGNIHGDGTLYLIIGNDSLAVTANWDGTNNIPKYVSIIFNDKYVYEGEIANNKPTKNGTWYSIEEGAFQSILNDVNDFYKEHEETIEKVVICTSIALTLVAIAAAEIASAGTATPFVIGATTAATAGTSTATTIATANSLRTIASIADKANTVINATDITMKVASNAIDKNWKGAVEEIATNAAFIIGGKLLMKSTSRKTCIPFSASAFKYNLLKRKVLITIGKPFKKVVRIAKGKGDVILINSSRAKILKRLSESKFGQRALKRQTKKAAKKYGNKLTGKAAAEKFKEICKDDKEYQELLKKVGQNEEDLVVETTKDGWTRVSYKGETSKWTSIEISPDKKTIKANGGSLIDDAHPKGGPQNEFLNHPLPNKTYIVDESTIYQTNSEGLVVKVDSNITKSYQTHGIGNETRGGRPDYNQVKKENNGNPTLDDGGHAVGKALGGCNESINITPQLKTINRGGDWKQLERDMLEAAQRGQKVEFSMEIKYAKGSRRPDKYVVEVKIDGKPYTLNGDSKLIFDNAIK